MLDAVNARLNTHGSQIEELQHFVKELQAVGDLRVQRFEPPEQYNTFALGEVPAEKVVCRHSQLRRQLEETRAEVASLRADLELNASHPAATLSERWRRWRESQGRMFISSPSLVTTTCPRRAVRVLFDQRTSVKGDGRSRRRDPG